MPFIKLNFIRVTFVDSLSTLSSLPIADIESNIAGVSCNL